MIFLHNKQTLDQIDWATKRDGEYVRNYFTPILQNGIERYIENVQSTIYLLEIDDLILPVTVNEKEFENSYVCSPYTHYISYAKEELWELNKPKVEKFLSTVIDCLGFLLKQTSINKIVSVNNWMLSTNLYFLLTESQISRITQFLIQQFPTHTLLFRSLNQTLHRDMLNAFEQNHYQRIMSRSIYLFNPERFRTLNQKGRKSYTRDKQLFQNSSYEIIETSEINEGHIPFIKQLYEELYIEKYSKHNPQFTDYFIQNVLQHHLIKCKMLKQQDSYEGVIGYFQRDGVLTTPILGYKMENGQKNGLYRLLSLLITEEVLEKNYFGHYSAGASEFKRHRGAVQDIEYSCFYQKHLPWKSRLVWMFLKKMMDTIVEPMARKLKF